MVACGGSPSADPTVSTPTVTATSSVSATTAVPPTTTTSTSTAATTGTTRADEAEPLTDGELVACMVGSWSLDTNALVVGIYALGVLADDPEKEDFVLISVSGGGDLTVASDQTITVVFETLTIAYQHPNYPASLPPGVLIEARDVYSGSGSAVFEVEGYFLSLPDTSGPGLEIRGSYRLAGAQSFQEASYLTVHPGALVLGMDVRPPRAPTDSVAVDCDADRLVVTALFGQLWVDAPEAVWFREQPEPP
jgi:hypothetical protein